LKAESRQEVLYLFGMAGLVIAGWYLGKVPGMQSLLESQIYPTFLNMLLATGLYASVAAIDTGRLKHDTGLILRVVTIGVALKTLVIGSVVYLFIQDWTAFAFAVIVAQIDPLAVGALTNQKSGRLGKRSKNILLAWASFDDPVTVVIAVLISTYLLSATLPNGSEYIFLQLGNLIIPAIAYFVSRFFGNHKYINSAILFIVFAISIWYGWMLAVAISGLFLRPFSGRITTTAVSAAFVISLLLVGAYLVFPVNMQLVFVLAFAAVTGQIIATLLLARELESRERLFVAFAQQNGITALILALFFARLIPNIVEIVALSVFVINVIHFLAFSTLDAIFYSNPSQPS
jgi:hypothetical protein